jgi:hypothetical protein
MKMNDVVFEDIQEMRDNISKLNNIINIQSDIIQSQNKYIIKLHQILAMHGIEFLNEGEENENYGKVL